ncbi:MAG: zinc-binding dehydrogenase [Candidatus Eremiobacteraeota bacterium]|nr:zinc-binding dehydrogenase [Candidatus Eremiobacteraeota bacterium]
MKGCRFGSHRVIEPQGVLPQPAQRIDNTMEIKDNEILLDVIRLNIDSASFHQIVEEVGRDEQKVADRVLSIVAARGKMHNPVTGSGGMLIARVAKIGADLKGKITLHEGDKIATLVSLSLTPLKIHRIKKVLLDQDQVEIEGQAVLFESGVYAKLPDDMSETLALSILDVAGAPAQVKRLAKKGQTIFILGAGGKSGLLCTAMARDIMGKEGKIIGMVHSERSVKTAEKLAMADVLFKANATNALEVYNELHRLTDGKMADLVINCVNVPDTEMTSILASRDRGTVYFFSMATSFTKAALGAEGIGYDVDMIIGNGYCRDHADISLDIVRKYPVLRQIFQEKFSK